MKDEDQMSPAAARLLQAARHADDPTPKDRARIGKSLQRAMIVGAVSAASSAASSAATAAGPSLLGKLIFVAATVGILGTGGIWLSQRSEKEDRNAPKRHDVAPAQLTSEAPPPAPTEEPARALQSQEQLLAETKLLQAAQKALRGGNQKRALTLLRQHEHRFPRGLLQPERDAARVFALCEAGDVKQAQQAAQRFAAAHATSPLLAKVKATCVR